MFSARPQNFISFHFKIMNNSTNPNPAEQEAQKQRDARTAKETPAERTAREAKEPKTDAPDNK